MKYLIVRCVTVVVVLMSLVLSAAPAGAVPIGHDAFRRTWERTDQPVLAGQISRTWMWGPEGLTGVTTEPYDDTPGKQRQVQYFDKSRMEISNPDGDSNSIWYVTNGLLVVEMVEGRIQLGNEEFDENPDPAQVNVAGDADDPTGPTYATFATLRDDPPYAAGAVITSRVDRTGNVTSDSPLDAYNAVAAHLVDVPGIRHQVASPFWQFMNSTGMVYESGQYVSDSLFESPFYATGYPITEAYWANVKVANTYRDVLMQCFERRCLTYTPGNPEGWQVEAGNVGQHYYQWRYGTSPPSPPPPPSDGIPTEGDVLYQSNLGDWPTDITDSGAVGQPSDDGTFYIIATPPNDAFYRFGAGPYGDASYAVDMFSVNETGDGAACLVIRASEQGGYHLCLALVAGSAVGTLAFYLDTTGEGALVELGSFPFVAPTTPEQLFTIKMIAAGNRFWFVVEGQLVGTAMHNGSGAGLTGIGVICTDSFAACGAGFTNLIIRSIEGSNTPPPPPPPPSATTFSDGTHLVGEDIPAGTYRNSDSSDGCYWERLSGLSGDLDDIKANSFTYARSIVTIAPSDLAFSSERCGTWTSDLSAITASPTDPFSDGMYIVGVDIGPGTWRNTDSSEGCYWARLSGFSGELDDILDNEFTDDNIQTVMIRASDEGFETSGCGAWMRIN